MNDIFARQILGSLDRNVVPEVKRNKQLVDDFMKNLSEKLRSRSDFRLNIVHCGSAYEKLAVDENADFDIQLQMGWPLESENFIVERVSSEHFTLRWKSHLPESVKLWEDSDGYLDSSRLRRSLFYELTIAIKQIQVEKAEITEIECKECLAALVVTINYRNGHKVFMDLVPQIVFWTWGQCPDLRPLRELPECLRSYINRSNKNGSPILLFSLGVVEAQPFDRRFNVSFCVLEKEFINSNFKLRDMVRLVKLVAKQYKWKRLFNFQPFMAKIIATKHYNSLTKLGLWEGYKTILGHLSDQVRLRRFDGYFIKDQITYWWDHTTSRKFQDGISNAIEMHPLRLREASEVRLGDFDRMSYDCEMHDNRNGLNNFQDDISIPIEMDPQRLRGDSTGGCGFMKVVILVVFTVVCVVYSYKFYSH